MSGILDRCTCTPNARVFVAEGQVYCTRCLSARSLLPLNLQVPSLGVLGLFYRPEDPLQWTLPCAFPTVECSPAGACWLSAIFPIARMTSGNLNFQQRMVRVAAELYRAGQMTPTVLKNLQVYERGCRWYPIVGPVPGVAVYANSLHVSDKPFPGATHVLTNLPLPQRPKPEDFCPFECAMADVYDIGRDAVMYVAGGKVSWAPVVGMKGNLNLFPRSLGWLRTDSTPPFRPITLLTCPSLPLLLLGVVSPCGSSTNAAASPLTLFLTETAGGSCLTRSHRKFSTKKFALLANLAIRPSMVSLASTYSGGCKLMVFEQWPTHMDLSSYSTSLLRRVGSATSSWWKNPASPGLRISSESGLSPIRHHWLERMRRFSGLAVISGTVPGREQGKHALVRLLWSLITLRPLIKSGKPRSTRVSALTRLSISSATLRLPKGTVVGTAFPPSSTIWKIPTLRPPFLKEPGLQMTGPLTRILIIPYKSSGSLRPWTGTALAVAPSTCLNWRVSIGLSLWFLGCPLLCSPLNVFRVVVNTRAVLFPRMRLKFLGLTLPALTDWLRQCTCLAVPSQPLWPNCPTTPTVRLPRPLLRGLFRNSMLVMEEKIIMTRCALEKSSAFVKLLRTAAALRIKPTRSPQMKLGEKLTNISAVQQILKNAWLGLRKLARQTYWTHPLIGTLCFLELVWLLKRQNCPSLTSVMLQSLSRPKRLRRNSSPEKRGPSGAFQRTGLFLPRAGRSGPCVAVWLHWTATSLTIGKTWPVAPPIPQSCLSRRHARMSLCPSPHRAGLCLDLCRHQQRQPPCPHHDAGFSKQEKWTRQQGPRRAKTSSSICLRLHRPNTKLTPWHCRKVEVPRRWEDEMLRKPRARPRACRTTLDLHPRRQAALCQAWRSHAQNTQLKPSLTQVGPVVGTSKRGRRNISVVCVRHVTQPSLMTLPRKNGSPACGIGWTCLPGATRQFSKRLLPWLTSSSSSRELYSKHHRPTLADLLLCLAHRCLQLVQRVTLPLVRSPLKTFRAFSGRLGMLARQLTMHPLRPPQMSRRMANLVENPGHRLLPQVQVVSTQFQILEDRRSLLICRLQTVRAQTVWDRCTRSGIRLRSTLTSLAGGFFVSSPISLSFSHASSGRTAIILRVIGALQLLLYCASFYVTVTQLLVSLPSWVYFLGLLGAFAWGFLAAGWLLLLICSSLCPTQSALLVSLTRQNVETSFILLSFCNLGNLFAALLWAPSGSALPSLAGYWVGHAMSGCFCLGLASYQTAFWLEPMCFRRVGVKSAGDLVLELPPARSPSTCFPSPVRPGHHSSICAIDFVHQKAWTPSSSLPDGADAGLAKAPLSSHLKNPSHMPNWMKRRSRLGLWLPNPTIPIRLLSAYGFCRLVERWRRRLSQGLLGSPPSHSGPPFFPLELKLTPIVGLWSTLTPLQRLSGPATLPQTSSLVSGILPSLMGLKSGRSLNLQEEAHTSQLPCMLLARWPCTCLPEFLLPRLAPVALVPTTHGAPTHLPSPVTGPVPSARPGCASPNTVLHYLLLRYWLGSACRKLLWLFGSLFPSVVWRTGRVARLMGCLFYLLLPVMFGNLQPGCFVCFLVGCVGSLCTPSPSYGWCFSLFLSICPQESWPGCCWFLSGFLVVILTSLVSSPPMIFIIIPAAPAVLPPLPLHQMEPTWLPCAELRWLVVPCYSPRLSSGPSSRALLELKNPHWTLSMWSDPPWALVECSLLTGKSGAWQLHMSLRATQLGFPGSASIKCLTLTSEGTSPLLTARTGKGLLPRPGSVRMDGLVAPTGYHPLASNLVSLEMGSPSALPRVAILDLQESPKPVSLSAFTQGQTNKEEALSRALQASSVTGSPSSRASLVSSLLDLRSLSVMEKSAATKLKIHARCLQIFAPCLLPNPNWKEAFPQFNFCVFSSSCGERWGMPGRPWLLWFFHPEGNSPGCLGPECFLLRDVCVILAHTMVCASPDDQASDGSPKQKQIVSWFFSLGAVVGFLADLAVTQGHPLQVVMNLSTYAFLPRMMVVASPVPVVACGVVHLLAIILYLFKHRCLHYVLVGDGAFSSAFFLRYFAEGKLREGVSQSCGMSHESLTGALAMRLTDDDLDFLTKWTDFKCFVSASNMRNAAGQFIEAAYAKALRVELAQLVQVDKVRGTLAKLEAFADTVAPQISPGDIVVALGHTPVGSIFDLKVGCTKHTLQAIETRVIAGSKMTVARVVDPTPAPPPVPVPIPLPPKVLESGPNAWGDEDRLNKKKRRKMEAVGIFVMDGKKYQKFWDKTSGDVFYEEVHVNTDEWECLRTGDPVDFDPETGTQCGHVTIEDKVYNVFTSPSGRRFLVPANPENRRAQWEAAKLSVEQALGNDDVDGELTAKELEKPKRKIEKLQGPTKEQCLNC
nr:ORF1a [Porcine reproductive and respiratory syndrome virus]